MARKRKKRTYGLGCVYQRGSANFWVKWRQDGRQNFRGGFERRDDAEKVLAQIVANLKDGKPGQAGLQPSRGDTPTIDGLAQEWLRRREATHRSWRDERNRWNRHMRPFFGGHRPADVNSALLRRFIEQKLGERLSSTSVGHCVRTLSSLYTDLVERGYVAANPVSSLPRSTRRLYRNAHDPKDTAFLEKLDDVRRLFDELAEPIAVAFVIGAMAGLRTGEILGIEWAHIDLRARRIQVRQQVRHGKLGPVKDNESRTVPIVTPLLPILESYRVKTGGQGFVFRPMVTGKGGTKTRAPTFLGIHSLHDHFARALEKLKLSPLTWYQATRHTFASQFVLSGGSIEKLSKIMGHSDITTTQRYAHLRPDLFRLEDVDRFAVNFMGKTEATARAPGTSRGTKRGKLVTKLVTVRLSSGGHVDIHT